VFSHFGFSFLILSLMAGLKFYRAGGGDSTFFPGLDKFSVRTTRLPVRYTPTRSGTFSGAADGFAETKRIVQVLKE